MDSICSAIAYADLKNRLDKSKNYVAARIGHMNDNTKEQLKRLQLDPPLFVKDAKAHISDVYVKSECSIQKEEPIYNLVGMYSKYNQSVVPVMDGDELYSLLSIDNISAWVLNDASSTQRPIYPFKITNWPKVLPGEFLKKGRNTTLDAALFVGAMEAEKFLKRLKLAKKNIEKRGEDKSLLLVTGNIRLLKLALKEKLPAIVVTGLTKEKLAELDTDKFGGSIYLSYTDTAETLRRLRMSISVKNIVVPDIPRYQVTDLFDDVKAAFTDIRWRGFPIFEGDRWVGFVTRRHFLEKPRGKYILVDHNELSQSVPGLEEADVVEIIDHHRLATEKTNTPIFIASEPVGSTCTIVASLFKRYGIRPSQQIARVLLSGIYADTLVLKSPTTTERDRNAVKTLLKLGKVTDPEAFAADLYSAMKPLNEVDPAAAIASDFKTYTEGGVSFGVGQIETNKLVYFPEVRDRFLVELEKFRRKNGLDWALLMITDVVRQTSVLLSTDYPQAAKLAYGKISDGAYEMPNVLSRKKQLLPEILRTFTE